MERSVIIIVVNGEPFIRLQLEHLYKLVDQIVIAEGPDRPLSRILKSKRSTDNTIKIIKEFPDPDNKITLIHTNCDKNTMTGEANKLCKGEFIYQADVDEFLDEKTIDAAFAVLKKGRCDNVRIPERWFYKWFDTYLSSGRPRGFRAAPNRFYRNKIDSGLIISHIPWVGYFKGKRHINASSYPLPVSEYIGHHFLAVYKSLLAMKMRYYASCREAVTEEIANAKIREFDKVKRQHIGKKKVQTYNGHLILRKEAFNIPAIDDNLAYLEAWGKKR
jgi:hypothetical protein